MSDVAMQPDAARSVGRGLLLRQLGPAFIAVPGPEMVLDPALRASN
jgi:hypothetical protein